MRYSPVIIALLTVGAYSEPRFTEEGAHVLEGLEKKHDATEEVVSETPLTVVVPQVEEQVETKSEEKNSFATTYLTPKKISSDTASRSPSQAHVPGEEEILAPVDSLNQPQQPSQEELEMENKKGMLAQGGGDMTMGSQPPPPASLVEQSSSNDASNVNGGGVSSVVLVPVMGLVGLVMVGVGLVFKHFKEQAIRQRRNEEEMLELMV